MAEALEIHSTLTLPAADLEWTAVRASGPGGQNVNKVASKVELRFNLAGTTALTEAVKSRLRVLCPTRLDAEGRILLVSQRTRDQIRNLEDAREKLRALVLKALETPRVRRPTRPTRASKERRIAAKRHTSDRKAARRTEKDD